MNVLTGCSFTECWTSFTGVNLSRSGYGLDRSIRTVLEYSFNTRPSAVLVQLSYADRIDTRTVLPGEEIEGPYVQDQQLCYDVLKRSVSSYFQWDKLFTNLITFCAWLRTQNIPYLVWDQCNAFDIAQFTEFRAMRKLGWITQDPGIINPFAFCANRYIAQQGGVFETDHVQHHYTDAELETILKPRLQQHIEEHKLGINL